MEPHARSDYQAVRAGYISVTPLQPDLTAHDALRLVERLIKPAAATAVAVPGMKRLAKPVTTTKGGPSRRQKRTDSHRR